MTSAVAIAPPRTFLRIPINEWKRKAVHMGAFSGAFLLPYLTPLQALLCVIAVFCGNAFLLPRLMPSIFRPDAEGKPSGGMEIVLYPAAIWASILAFSAFGSDGWFPWWLWVIGLWFCLALGDGIIGIMNGIFRFKPFLPWNPRKSIVASIISAPVIGLIASICIFLNEYLRGAHRSTPTELHEFTKLAFSLIPLFVLVVLIESFWLGIADNLTIPFFLIAAFVLFHQYHLSSLLVPLVFALLAWIARKTTARGAIFGGVIAATLMSTDGFLFLFLLGFFILGIAATSFGKTKKASLGIAEAREGRRDIAEIFGAAGVAVWMTPLAAPLRHAITEPDIKAWFLVIISPLIAKTMDTVSSEIGKAVGGKTISLRSSKLVPPGTEGAISLAGTLAGIAAAALLAALILPLHWGGMTEVAALVVIAILANLFESYWGSWAEPRGMSDGPHTNFLMTLVAATLAWLLWLRG